MNADLQRALIEEPWLAPFAADAEDLEDARRAFRAAQRIGLRELAERGERLETRVSRRDGLLTTALAPHDDAETDHQWPASRTELRSGSAPPAPIEPTIEPGGTIVRGCLMPYNERIAVVSPGRKGPVAHFEAFTAESIEDVGALFNTPMMHSHRPDVPLGRVLSTHSKPSGLHFEGELLASDHELEGIARRVRGNILSGLSIAFLPSRRDIWKSTSQTGLDLPLVLRRGARVREVSLCVWPAYDRARVSGIHRKTAAAERRHVASQIEIAATKAVLGRVGG